MRADACCRWRAVDFGKLEQVFVMLRRGPTMELLFGSKAGRAVDEAGESAGTERSEPAS